jgi:hypothetical protein
MSDKSETEELKARLKSTWMAGDFGRVAKMAEGEAEAFILVEIFNQAPEF